jgi:hypothetical protein
MDRACSCCTRNFDDGELTRHPVGKGYASRTVYYCADCIEKKNQQEKFKQVRTTYRKSVYARVFR